MTSSKYPVQHVSCNGFSEEHHKRSQITCCGGRALDRSKAELRKITLPMGPNGINQLMTWRTTYGADFEAWKSDIASSNLIAAHIKRIMQSPTATVGPVLGGRG